MPHDSARNNDRSGTPHYTMKTSSRPPLGSSHSHTHHPRHSHSNSQSMRASRSSTTPMASPRMPHSVGQQYPPATKLSPGVQTDARTPSPNYFGLNIEHSADPRDSVNVPRDNWSPPTSSVRSFGTAIPKSVPLDANPEFEAFKRQADANWGKQFSLSSSHFGHVQPSASSPRPKPARRPTNHSDTPSEQSTSKSSLNKLRDGSSRMDVDSDSLHDSAYVSSDSKRNSEVSLNAPSFFGAGRHESPAHAESPFDSMRRSTLSKLEDRHPRLSLPQNRLEQLSSEPAKPRSDTLPASLENAGPGLMLPNQLSDIIKSLPESDFLILDLRVSTQYSLSRVQGALNFCIPTTLLKRATFDLQKLKATLLADQDREKFSKWPSIKHLILYDASSAEKRDATSAMNMYKKFANEGYRGQSYILRGGFNAFANSDPDLIDKQTGAGQVGLSGSSSGSSRPLFAPVIGGVMLPSTTNNANPFFSNIRQNMDLADGVGQLDIAVPANLDPMSLPQWLSAVINTGDHGKMVSERFLNIERKEQARMRDAYSISNQDGTQPPRADRVQLSGIEKGGKNRYKDILPFEHARVRLSGRPEGACDYINASHVQASRSNKRYIASQGPLPATFEDFWSVIWDQDVRVVVMLTAESEGGQLKCHSYWHDRDYGSIKLKPLSEKKVSLDIDKHRSSSTASTSSTSSSAESGRRRANTLTNLGTTTPTPQAAPQAETPYVIIRKFALSHSAHPFAPIREITHLHYPSWPDFGAPAQPSHLLALVELANVMQRAALPIDANAITAAAHGDQPATMKWYDEPESEANDRPMLVHCSAGCGRTGTFCTVDSVIDMLKRQRLAAVEARNQHDVDEDVEMEDALSPLSTSKPNPFNLPMRGASGAGSVTAGGVQDPHGAGIDLSWVGSDGIDLIEKTVEDFRGQRLSMVQSLRQFVLCYESILEWVWRLQERNIQTAPGRPRARSGSLESHMR